LGKVKPPQKAKLICGMISSDIDLFESISAELVGKYGEIDSKSDIMEFTETDYYKKEMGDGLKKFFVSFKELIEPSDIADVKLFTQELEEKKSSNGKRTINLDPGYIDEAKLVLASTKDNQHRIYIGKSIFAEITLRYKGNSFSSWEWTYRDYKREEYINYFIKVRDIFRRQMGRKEKNIKI